MILKILKVLILLLINKEVATFKINQIKQEKSENEIVKLLLDPNFAVDSIAIWSVNEISELQNDLLKAVRMKKISLRQFNKMNTTALREMRFEMEIIFINAEDVVSKIKIYNTI